MPNAENTFPSSTKTASTEEYDIVIIGSGTGGKLIAWTFASDGQRVAMIERKSYATERAFVPWWGLATARARSLIHWPGCTDSNPRRFTVRYDIGLGRSVLQVNDILGRVGIDTILHTSV